MTESAPGLAHTVPPAKGKSLVVEPRWPIALAVAAIIAATIALRLVAPVHEVSGPAVWVVTGLEIGLLFALIAADSAHVTRRTKWLRRLAIALTATLAAIMLADTVVLIASLISGGEVTKSADALLASGGAVWLGNCLVFGLAYWQLDSGGPLARYRGEVRYPDFAFVEQINPDLAPPDWRPRYVDYLALGFTTSTAFSPTDVMPLSPFAKLAMALQSLISLVILGLVIARAVNVLT